MTKYCELAPGHPFHGPYHDLEYGFPVTDDNILFERLVLEINQAGLSWLTILKKREAFRAAYNFFDIEQVAMFGDAERKCLLKDVGLIRNKLKVNAAIENARRISHLKKTFGSFAGWLEHHHPLNKTEWIEVFKKTFLFTGGKITGEFLMSTGYLPGAHEPSCPVLKKIACLNPPYLR